MDDFKALFQQWWKEAKDDPAAGDDSYYQGADSFKEFLLDRLESTDGITVEATTDSKAVDALDEDE